LYAGKKQPEILLLRPKARSPKASRNQIRNNAGLSSLCLTTANV